FVVPKSIPMIFPIITFLLKICYLIEYPQDRAAFLYFKAVFKNLVSENRERMERICCLTHSDETINKDKKAPFKGKNKKNYKFLIKYDRL
ncbi:MAG: hypothetical protein KH943_05415, partial [Haemophilus parahaemolyticus]|nr:hypothetical protein [Haemophilus parahaemolyticus]